MSEAKIKEATAAIALALVGLDAPDAYAALDRASVILPRRAFLVGERHDHDGDPNNAMAQYVADVVQVLGPADPAETRAGLIKRIGDALKKVRPPWV